jgi:ABC-type phosphate transport system substrate-binding protein
MITRRRIGRWAAVAFGLAAAFTWAPGKPGPAPVSASGGAYRIVVNPANPVTVVDRKFLSDVFLKKITRWEGGEAARPVDLRADASARQQFSDEVLRRSVGAVKAYWQQLVFSGRDVPPPEVDTDEQVIRYVLRFTGGVGYVSGAANLDRVKPISIK